MIALSEPSVLSKRISSGVAPWPVCAHVFVPAKPTCREDGADGMQRVAAAPRHVRLHHVLRLATRLGEQSALQRVDGLGQAS